ncbi:MAG: GNAT family N-acetyltransferase [Defluviitaleaceae bacterium]|nr:GNAT family N-acetyltransferase [Defluviitaleaceae bacterium]
MLRPYQKNDLTVCIQLFVAAFNAPPLNYQFITHEKTRRYLRDIVSTPGFNGFMYKINGQPAAFCFGVKDDYFHAPQYEIKEFAVCPAQQGKGTGSAFLREIEKTLTKEGVTAISLQTSRAIPAYGFYKKNGFTEYGETVGFMKSLI